MNPIPLGLWEITVLSLVVVVMVGVVTLMTKKLREDPH